MDKIVDVLKELLGDGVGKILAIIIIPILPIFALFGNFHAIGNYWLDLLIAFGITGTFALIVWIAIRGKKY